MRTIRRRDGQKARRATQRLRRVNIVPALFTLANGVCGFASIIVASRISPAVLLEGGEAYAEAVHLLGISGWLIFLGMVFDALDGRMARLAGTASKFGAELDSLCDVITFGAAPAFLLLKLGPTADRPVLYKILFVASTFFVICVILRLARFNVETTPDESSHQSFKGLPSPAAAGCIAAVAGMRADLENFAELINFVALTKMINALLPFGAIALGVLMVSVIPYPHLVNQTLRGRQSFHRLVELLIIGIVAIVIREFSLVIAFWGFALYGPILQLLRRGHGPQPATVSQTVPSPPDASSDESDPPRRANVMGA